MDPGLAIDPRLVEGSGGSMPGRVVVGIDGSASARAAWDAALDQARWRDARIDAVHAYAAWVPYAGMDVAIVPPPSSPVDLDGEAEQLVRDTIGDVPDGLDVRIIAREGHAAGVLIAEAEGADLLVVGTRGRGGFAGLVLGSTSHAVLGRATCPVLVVPAELG